MAHQCREGGGRGMLIVKRLSLPPGEYYFCDPAYAAKERFYRELIDHAIAPDRPFRMNGYCGHYLLKDGKAIAAFHTMYGDGAYTGEAAGRHYGNFGVDSGMLGVVDKRLARSRKAVHDCHSDVFEFSLKEPGALVLTDDYEVKVMREGETLLTVEAGDPESVMAEKYGQFLMAWLRDNVDAADAAKAAAGYLAQPRQRRFREYIDANGWSGKRPPEAEALNRLGELRWHKLDGKDIESFPDWMKRVYDDFAEIEAFPYRRAMEISGQPMDRLNFFFLRPDIQATCLLDYGMFIGHLGQALEEKGAVPDWLPKAPGVKGPRPC